jgi:hypothetical protein
MTPKHFAAALGFAFVAAWIAFGFSDALLCLLGAGAAYATALILEGQVDLGELQDRIRPNTGQPTAPVSPPPSWPTPRPSRRVR